MELGTNSAHAQHNFQLLLKSSNIRNCTCTFNHRNSRKSRQSIPWLRAEIFWRLPKWNPDQTTGPLGRPNVPSETNRHTQCCEKVKVDDHLWKYCTNTNVLKSRGTVQNDNEKLSDPTSSSQWIVQHGKSYSKCILQGYWTKVCFMPQPLSHHSGWPLSEVITWRLMCLARWLICSPKPSSWQALATGCTSNTSER